MDMVIRDALIAGRKERLDIGIVDGIIKRISSKIRESGRREIDADGRLVSPGFIDSHVHMDKCLLLGRLGAPRGFSSLQKKILAIRELKKSFTAEDVKSRVISAVKTAVSNGTTTLRTHVEADPVVELRAVEGVLKAKEACKNIVDIQTIAFPQEGWRGKEGSLEYESRPFIQEAIKRGIDIVGGNVNRAVWDSDPEQQVDDLFEIAVENNRDIDMHLDNSDNPVAFTLPYVAQKTIECGYQGRVTVAHIPSLSNVPDRLAFKAIELIKEADLNVCILPSRIKLTRVRELMAAGVNVICGTDNMQDAFIQLGNADMLNAMLLLAQVTGMGFDDELESIYKTGTSNAARALRIANEYGIGEGKRADLVILEAESVPEAIRNQAGRFAVIKGGVIVARKGCIPVVKGKYHVYCQGST